MASCRREDQFNAWRANLCDEGISVICLHAVPTHLMSLSGCIFIYTMTKEFDGDFLACKVLATEYFESRTGVDRMRTDGYELSTKQG